MKYGKYEKDAPKESRNGGTKMLALILSLVLLVGCVVGTTLAWLADKTEPVKNVFTASNIKIELNETQPADPNNIQMIPGHTIAKNPVVTVKQNSEKCYLFVEVTEGADLDDYITYSVDTLVSAWQQVPGEDHVYYKIVDTNTTQDQEFPILTGNQVQVKDGVTNEMMTAIQNESKDVSLSFTAYAIQYYKTANTEEGKFALADAWTEAKAQNP